MGTLVSIIGDIVCILMILRGYFWPVVFGGVVGSFLGVAGLGGGMSGLLRGTVGGALIAKAME